MKLISYSKFLAFRKRPSLTIPANLNIELLVKQWKPTFLDVFPPVDSNRIVFFFYWVYFFIIQRNEKYSVWLAYYNSNVVYQSVILPDFWRFPFMEEGDIQIGMVYTHPAYRNQGIASKMVRLISTNQEKNTWYLTTHNNIYSTSIALKNGFQLYATCIKKSIELPFIKHLGKYYITEII